MVMCVVMAVPACGFTLAWRGVRRDKWINHSLLVPLLVWQIHGVLGMGCSMQKFYGVVAALI